MFCPKCGAKLDDGAKFCPSCGASIGQEPQPTQQQATQQPYQPYTPYPPYPTKPRPTVNIDAKTILYMAAAFLHLMLLIFWWIPSLGPKGQVFAVQGLHADEVYLPGCADHHLPDRWLLHPALLCIAALYWQRAAEEVR